MPINILMPALSPTMEKGNLAKWLKKEGDKVKSGDVIAEIETDKATMEVEAVDEGTIAKILVPEGTQDVPVNDIIAVLAGDGEDVKAAGAAAGAAAAGFGASVGFGAGAAPAPAPAAFTSSPSPASTAMISLTGTSCVPSGTTILASTPSSMDSYSIVALSVSISAMTSPALTASPSFFSHLARLPFSMVGESAGMRMLTGIRGSQFFS